MKVERKTALGREYEVLTFDNGIRQYKLNGLTLFDNSVITVDEMRGVLYLEGLAKQKEDSK